MATMYVAANSSRRITEFLKARFRLNETAQFEISDALLQESGYFRFGPEIVCYGHCAGGRPSAFVEDTLYDVAGGIRSDADSIELPFDPVQVVDNLRHERYAAVPTRPARTVADSGLFRDLYYSIRPLLPVPIRRPFQKFYFRGWQNIPFPKWPVDLTVENIFEHLLAVSMKQRGLRKIPFVWFWPDGSPSCTIITHDVETPAGAGFCPALMDLNDSFGIKTSFQIVPENRYPVGPAFLDDIRARGFEIAVQDLNHDGLLYRDREEFLRRSKRINAYGKEFGADGFRAAVLYRNVDWYDDLDFIYDMSIPNVAHLDPQRGGCCTVFPYFIGRILELPVTTTQDYTLFHMFNDYSTELWQEQIAAIRQKHGLISFIIHPDYIIDRVPRTVYTDLLQNLHSLRANGQTWIALPREVAAWWKQRSEQSLVRDGASWRVEGPGSERARVAYAVLENDTLTYEL